MNRNRIETLKLLFRDADWLSCRDLLRAQRKRVIGQFVLSLIARSYTCEFVNRLQVRFAQIIKKSEFFVKDEKKRTRKGREREMRAQADI